MTTKAAPAKLFANAAHHAGCLWWTDLSTPDPDGAKRFYGGLFGWSFDEVPLGDAPDAGTYSMAKVDGLTVAALSGQRPEMAGMPPIWTSYVTVDDVDAATARARELGATIVAEPFEVLDVGRMCVIQDPSGASIALWQTRTNPGADAVSQPGAYCWSELLARGDLDVVTSFWTDLMGWTTQVSDMGIGSDYTTFLHDGHPACGMMAMPPMVPEQVPSNWIVYFAVADIAETLTKVRELGGSVDFEPMVAPGVGSFSMVQDPQGGQFYVMQLDEWPEPEA